MTTRVSLKYFATGCRSNVIYTLYKRDQSSAKFLDFLVLLSKFTKFLAFLKQKVSFSSNFAPLFSIMRHKKNKKKFYILLTKGAYQSTNLVKFQLSSQKSEISHFGELLL